MQRCDESLYAHFFEIIDNLILFFVFAFPGATDQSVGVAVGPALAQIMAELKNLNSKFWNSKIGVVAGSVLKTMVKATVGHPAGVPTDAALVALGPVPVPVGTALPPAAIMAGLPWTSGRIASLTAAQLNDLEWFYNEQFVGQTVGDRRIAFLAFLGA
jgi:hypothetical protein